MRPRSEKTEKRSGKEHFSTFLAWILNFICTFAVC